MTLGMPPASWEKTALSILYIGYDGGTSRHRADALRRLGHEVRLLDITSFLGRGRIAEFWNFHTGALGLGGIVRRGVLDVIAGSRFDIAWVDAGDLVSPELVRDLKHRANFVVNYNVDDPFGKRDGKKWRLYLRGLPLYDLIVVIRDENIKEAYAFGAKEVMRVHRSADEIAHAPRDLTDAQRGEWGSEVAVIGSWVRE
jgi:spore maturation protein CgeB